MITFSDIQQAHRRIASYIYRTPLLRVPALDELAGCQVYLKPECLQLTGSFKIRGATNRISQLTDSEKASGIVCASSGNHAKAVACAAARLGIDALFVMPVNANPAKLNGISKYGGTIIFEGTLSSQRAEKARQLQRAGRIMVHSHADDQVIAGQGTIGIEILEDCSDLDVVVAPVGGGGLISGIATAVKHLNPQTKVIGVEPEGAARYTESLKAGHPITLSKTDTIADGTRCDHADAGNFSYIARLVDSLVLADDDAIRCAMRAIIGCAKIVAEPSSALGIAAAIEGKLPIKPSDKVCFIITAGNNDLSMLSTILGSIS